MGLMLLIFGVTLTLLGVGFIAAAYFVVRHRAGLEERCSASAEAELVDKACRTIEFSEDVSINYHGVYSFQTGDGVRVQAENKSGYGLPEEIPGPIVTIRYNPNNPGEFLIPSEQSYITESKVLPGLRRGGIAMLVIGVPLIVAGAMLMRM